MSSEKDKPVNPMQNLVQKSTREPAPFVAKLKRKSDKPLYPMTFRIPRPTADRLHRIAHEKNTSLQQICAEALDRWLRANDEGAFLPEGWEE